jgi:hypothetical protein
LPDQILSVFSQAVNWARLYKRRGLSLSQHVA